MVCTVYRAVCEWVRSVCGDSWRICYFIEETSLFKQSNLRIALLATNTTYKQLTEKPTQNNPSGIYELKCNTYNRAYIGQSGGSIAVKHKEHVRYIRTNNPTSAYALHILNNKHDYGTADETLKLLKPCHKGPRMNCWETFYMQLFHQHGTLINCYVHTRALLLAFRALVWRMRLTKVTHAIARALNTLNGVENSNAWSSARDSDLGGFSFNIAFNFYLLI